MTYRCTARLGSRPGRLLAAVICAALAGAAVGAGAAPPDVAGALRRLAADTLVTREIRLRELGFTGPAVLGSRDARREVYFPVPVGLPLRDATLQFDASYLRGDGGRTTLLLSLDGYPVSARAFTLDQGDAGIRLGVDGRARASGFVRFGAVWASIILDAPCAEERLIGNVLQIDPQTRLTYTFDSAGVTDLATAWSALPAAPVILVPPGVLAVDAYDAAWRLGVALARAGKHPLVSALAAVGDTVDLTGTAVPAELRAIPAFAALAGGGSHQLAGPAESGAFLVLATGARQADIVVADGALLTAAKQGLDALAQEIGAGGAPAAAAFSAWRAKAFALFDTALEVAEVRLATFAGRPAIVVAPGAGAQAAGLFDTLWRRALLARSVVARRVEPEVTDAAIVPLGALGGVPGTLDLLARGDWTATFDLGAGLFAGRVPSAVVIDVAAAPGAGRSPPIATVFLNDHLLGARRLEADGQPERIQARVPAYALAQRNLLRVSFQRQPFVDECRELPQAFPVAVLPTSHVRLAPATPAEDFPGMIVRLANQASLMVPSAYLQEATVSLPTVIRLADAVGLAPTRARLMVVPEDTAAVAPASAFLAFDLRLADAKPKAVVAGDRVVIRGRGDVPYFDVTGLTRVGLIQVLRAGAETGILWQTIGPAAPLFDQPLRLAHGDLAVVGATGPLVEIDSADPAGAAKEGEPTLELAWERTRSWGVPVMIGLVVLFLLLLARAAWVRGQRARAQRR